MVNKPQTSFKKVFVLVGWFCCEASYLIISRLQTFVPLASLCVHVQSCHHVHIHQLQLGNSVRWKLVNKAGTAPSTYGVHLALVLQVLFVLVVHVVLIPATHQS